MSLTLVNKLYKGSLVIWQDENFLLNRIHTLNDNAKIVTADLVSSENKIVTWSCTYDEFLKAVVK